MKRFFKDKKRAVAVVLSTAFVAASALSILPAKADEDGDCPPCPYWLTLPNGNCMIDVFCGPE